MLDINKNNKPIGVFDSGVGGLSVFIELKKILPNENFVFLADQQYVPYGDKSKKELIERGIKIADYFIKHRNIKMMVIACNTSTCNSIDELRKRYSFPIVGTVPAVKVAAEKTKTGTVAVISTPATSKSQALKKLIEANCKSLDVLNISCPHLENVVEQGEFHSAEVDKLLLKYLGEIKNSDADYLVLGCTHYPFLRKYIGKIFGPGVKLLDGGKAIAKQTKVLLENNHIKNKEKKKGETLYFTTGDPLKFSKVASKLLKAKVKAKKIKI